MRAKASVVLLFLASVLSAGTAVAGDFDLPADKIAGGAPGTMMHSYLLQQTEQASQRWKAAYEQCKSPQQIAAYRQRVRGDVLNCLGGLPERTPLEPQVTGVVSRPGYRVEKILFQSQPKHYVTALLFLPADKRFSPPYPGVLEPCGHWIQAKAWPEYQSMGALLALSGMAALVFDPIDEGERAQRLGDDGWPALALSNGHNNVGPSCILLGQNTARFEIWDGMRAIDYLQSRRDIDPKRIGCTGNSGGATQTTYLMALDDRIGCAAPSCFLTGLPKTIVTLGPGDAEQCFFGQLAFGADHADFVMMRAPSPVLICAATHDFFDIGGTWEVFRYAKRFYTRLGLPERVDILENDNDHNYDVTQRQAVARWMSRWLLGKDQVIVEPNLTLLTEEECRCSPGGQVMLLPGARSVYDLNDEYEKALAKRRTSSWATRDRAFSLNQVRRLAGIRKLAEIPAPQNVVVATLVRPGYKIEKLVIQPEAGIALPALLFLPDKPQPGNTLLYLHEKGKAADAGPGGPIQRRVLAGETILAPDLRGTGQTEEPVAGYFSPGYEDVNTAYMLGRSYVGMRAEDILDCARYAAGRAAGAHQPAVRLVAIGSAGIPALHAAALEPQLFSAVRLSHTLASWATILRRRVGATNEIVNVVHGALVHYDLPDLATVLGDKLTIEQPDGAAAGPGGNVPPKK